MEIPDALLAKTNKAIFYGRTQNILEEGWHYLQKYFENEHNYLYFVGGLSKDNYEIFLYTIFFFYAHDLYGVTKGDKKTNIDGFMYQMTLSIIEYLNCDIKGPKNRIKDFIKYFSLNAQSTLNKKIVARFPDSKQLQFWEILYDMRNKFIHEAGWFDLIPPGSPASISLSVVKNKGKKNDKYIAKIGIRFETYLRFFLEAYLNYFGYKAKD
jgi:hypothetical protein